MFPVAVVHLNFGLALRHTSSLNWQLVCKVDVHFLLNSEVNNPNER